MDRASNDEDERMEDDSVEKRLDGRERRDQRSPCSADQPQFPPIWPFDYRNLTSHK